MQITEALKHHLNKELSNSCGREIVVKGFRKIHGGSVNYSFLLKTNEDSFFIKFNNALQFPDMFKLELMGLTELKNLGGIIVPNNIIEGLYENTSYLVLELIEIGEETNFFWDKFGRQLANQHRIKQEYNGLCYSNYIGSIPQKNPLIKNWPEFFGEHRILVQAKIAFDSGRIDKSLLNKIDILTNKLDELFPNAPASLLHGDLWSGNFMINKSGHPVIFDPAIYYGNREMDIAMSMLFGGFKKRFYEAYQEVYPLSKNWEERIDLCNAYPLLIHVNLFGSSYSQRLKTAIKRY